MDVRCWRCADIEHRRQTSSCKLGNLPCASVPEVERISVCLAGARCLRQGGGCVARAAQECVDTGEVLADGGFVALALVALVPLGVVVKDQGAAS